MNTPQKPNPNPKQQPLKEFNKSNCQLSDFPIIKLHILQNIQILNLSRNHISNFSNLQIHAKSSQHVLSKLKHINLAYNHIQKVELLYPLAMTARNIEYINVQQNPFVEGFNYLYEIIVMFQEIQVVRHRKQVQVNQEIRERMIQHQIKGGDQIQLFLKTILQLNDCSQSLKNAKKHLQKYQQMLQNLKQLDTQQSISSKNSILFQSIHQFLKFNQQKVPNRNNTFRSPQHYQQPRNQIQIHSEYQISKSPNVFQKYLTDMDEKDSQNLMYYYFREMIQKQSIHSRIIQEIQMQQQEIRRIENQNQSPYPLRPFLEYLNILWKKQYELTNQLQPRILNHFSSKHKNRVLSPFKSENTDFTSRVMLKQKPTSLIDEPLYFGMDQSWTQQTLQFIKHRLLSLIKKIAINISQSDQYTPQQQQIAIQHQQHQQQQEYQQDQDQQQNYNQQIQDIKDYSLNNNHNKHIQYLNLQQNEQFKHHTFSNLNPNHLIFSQTNKSNSINPQQLLSPKSKNRFIIGSSMRIFQQIIKKIVFKRIQRTTLIKYDHVYHFQEIFGKIVKREQEYGFRKLFKEALYLECIFHKLHKNILRRVFKAWKMIKKRKVKLLKGILRRKNQKESAFTSVFLTQWRITARNIKNQQKMRKAESQIFGKQIMMDQDHLKMKRSMTSKKLPNAKKFFNRQTRGSLLGGLAMKKTKLYS